MTRVLMEGSHAIAEAAIQAGCRFYAGYPITPSTEILEYMSHRLPQVGGVCMNAESELEAINMVWGAAGCGVRAMIASTGQGISLMQESFAELANAEIPCVIVNMMRGQGDYYQATRGGGHGDYRHIVLAPHTVQEAVDLVMLAFHLADRWRNPALVLGDFVLGHTSEAVEFRQRDESDLLPKTWAATGKGTRKSHNVTPLGAPQKLDLKPGDHYQAIAAKLPRLAAAESRAETGLLDDAEVAVVAFGSPARFVKFAVHACRAQGMKVGWVRPISLWPFPAETVAAAATGAQRVLPDRFVFTLRGDGDMVSEGLQEIIHSAARGERFTAVLLNNGVFGETGGHMTTTSVLGQRTKTTMDEGRVAEKHGYPIKIADLVALVDGSSYVARGAMHTPAAIAWTKRILGEAFRVQLEGRGFSFVELLTMCPTDWYVDPIETPDWIEQNFTGTYPLKILKHP